MMKTETKFDTKIEYKMMECVKMRIFECLCVGVVRMKLSSHVTHEKTDN